MSLTGHPLRWDVLVDEDVGVAGGGELGCCHRCISARRLKWLVKRRVQELPRGARGSGPK